MNCIRNFVDTVDVETSSYAYKMYREHADSQSL
jgi:hypothetical protein